MTPKTFYRTLMLFAICFALVECKKPETPAQTENNPPTAEEFQNLMNQSLSSKKQSATFIAEDGFTFTSTKGVTLQVFPNALTYNGQAVTGQVDLEFTEFFGRGAMAVSNVTTIGTDTTGQKQLLTSGGTFLIKAYQNGNELSCVNGMMLKVPASLTGGVNPLMKPFVGNIESNGNLNWIELFGSDFFVLSTDGTYNALLSNFGWFNCDIFISFPNKGQINVQVPEGYNAQNSTVFASVMNMPNTLSCLFTNADYYPINQTVHLIFVSVQNSQYVYSIKSIVVEAENNVTFSSQDLQTTSEENLTQLINNLP